MTLHYAEAQRQVSLSVLTPVFNERHLVLASLARVLKLESELICYKAVNTSLLKFLPLRSNDFRFEIELTFKLAKPCRSSRGWIGIIGVGIKV